MRSRIESRIASVGIGRENNKVCETLWSGMLLGRGHLICKYIVTAGRLLSLVLNLDLDSKQRGQYFNLHLHLKLFKGWQPPSYPFTSHLLFFSFLFFFLSSSYHPIKWYLPLYSAILYNILYLKNVSNLLLGYINNLISLYIDEVVFPKCKDVYIYFLRNYTIFVILMLARFQLLVSILFLFRFYFFTTFLVIIFQNVVVESKVDTRSQHTWARVRMLESVAKDILMHPQPNPSIYRSIDNAHQPCYRFS